MKKPVILIIISTLCYNLPSLMFDMDGFDFSTVPVKFYQFYCFFIALSLLLVCVYAIYLFLATDLSEWKQKILYLWLLIAERSTFFDHVIRKYLLEEGHSMIRMGVTFSVFFIFCTFFLYRAIKNPKSDTFKPNHTYLIRSKPKNLPGIINYIIRHSGHISVYQDGQIYGFKQKTKTVEQRPAYAKYMTSSDISLKEIPKIKNIESLIGKKYNIFKFNCNHLAKNAQRS